MIKDVFHTPQFVPFDPPASEGRGRGGGREGRREGLNKRRGH